MSDTRNVKLGVCTIMYDGADLGYTKGGVEAIVTTETHEVQIDQFGKVAINESIMARAASVKVPLAETTVENLVRIMPGATLTTEGLKKVVKVQHGIGTDLLALAKPLVLHPQANAVTARNDDFVLLLAGTAGAMQYAYKLEEERIFNIEFKGYPSPQTNRIFYVGDLTAGSVPVVFDFSTDIFTAVAHGLVTGQAVTFDATTFPTLTAATMILGKLFYVRVASADTFTIHPTWVDADGNTNKILGTDAGVGIEFIAI